MSHPASAARPFPDSPLVVACGLRVNSTAMLVEFTRRHIRPDLILFVDTVGEKPNTYPHFHVIVAGKLVLLLPSDETAGDPLATRAPPRPA